MPANPPATAEQLASLTKKLDEFVNHVTDSLARTETTVKNTNDRLFGYAGQSGILKYLADDQTEIKKTLALKTDDKDFKELIDKHDKLQTKVTWYTGILTGIQVLLAALFGWHNGG